jgi:hypothetical protein
MRSSALGTFSCILLFATIAVRAVTAQAPVTGVEVIFRLDDRTVKGPKTLTIEAGPNQAVLRISRDNPGIAPWSPKDARTLLLPEWVDRANVDIRVRVKKRNLHFKDVAIGKVIGRLIINVDRLPFDEDYSYLADKTPGAIELYWMLAEPMVGDGLVYFYTK